MLRAAKVTKDDIVYDLGAGDGRIPSPPDKEFGARAIGIQYDADIGGVARRNARRAGMDERVRIVTGDIFKENFSTRPSTTTTCR